MNSQAACNGLEIKEAVTVGIDGAIVGKTAAIFGDVAESPITAFVATASIA